MILCGLWIGFIAVLPGHHLRSFQEFILLLSPLLIFGCKGGKFFKEYHFKNYITVAFVLFFVLTLISQLVTINFWRGLDEVRSYHLKILFILTTFIYLMRKNRNVERLSWGFVGAIFLCTFFGYYNTILGEAWRFFPANSPEYGLSSLGLYKNDFGAYFSFYVPIVFGFANWKIFDQGINKFSTILLIILTVAAFPILFLTQSRASIVASFGGCFFILVMISIRLMDWKYLSWVLFIFGVVVIVTLIIESRAQILSEWSYENLQRTLRGRLSIWSSVWARAKNYFWFGIDYSHESYVEIISSPWGRDTGPHNLYLDYLVKTGVIGLSGFVLMSVVFVYKSISTFLMEDLNVRTWLTLSVCGAFISGYLIRGIVAQYYPLFDWMVLISFYYALLLPRNDLDE